MGRREDAAVRQLAPRVAAELSQATGRAIAQGKLVDAEALERSGRVDETTGSGRGDERLREADRARAERLAVGFGEQSLRSLVVSDQETGVDAAERPGGLLDRTRPVVRLLPE